MSKKIQYQISVEGQLDERWRDWFGDMNIKSEGGLTLLSGPVRDQAALHGILSRIRDLGLPLISARRLESGEDELRQQKREASDK